MDDGGLRIVHRTDRFVVVDKPAGLLSVPGKGERGRDCVPERVRRMFPEASGPLTVHRLDMDTSGLLVVALDAEAQRELSGQFERREVEKSYIAVVDGVMGVESGTIEAPIRPDLSNRPYQVVDFSHRRPAVTAFKVIEIEAGGERGRTRVELIPLTGRTHQLRVHMAWRGHAILGDVLYGEQPRIANAAPRLLLHAARLVFTDPGSGRRVEVVSGAEF